MEMGRQEWDADCSRSCGRREKRASATTSRQSGAARRSACAVSKRFLVERVPEGTIAAQGAANGSLDALLVSTTRDP